MAAYVRMLLDQDQLGDAEQLLNRLDRVSNIGQSAALRAELMFRSKKWAEVPVFLAAAVSQEKTDLKDRLDRTVHAAQLLEDFGRPADRVRSGNRPRSTSRRPASGTKATT